jgi:hypothetical protein
MDNINKDNLVKFISYFIIVFLLSVVLYLMYIDFVSETFNSKTEKFSDVNIKNKLKYINLIEEKQNSNVVEHLNTNQIDPLIFDPNAAYVLKKDLLSGDNQLAVTNAVCAVNDKTLIKDGVTHCISNGDNMYLNSSGTNKFSIKVLPDGMYGTPNTDTMYAYYDYDVTISDLNNKDLYELRKSYFYFPDDKVSSVYSSTPRTFSYGNKYDTAIVNYFNNYSKYMNNIDLNVYNQLIDNQDDNSTPSSSNISIIKKYYSYLQSLLLLMNSKEQSPFVYNSGYSFDINDIKLNLIGKYSTLLLDSSITIQYNMIINDTSNMVFFYDSPNNMNVYAFELNPNIVVTFSNLKLTFSKLPKNIKHGSIWSLMYVTSLTPIITPDVVYTYSDLIEFPISLPLAIPTTNNWENNTTNGVIYYFQNIFKHGGLGNINIMDITNNDEPITNTTGDQVAIQNLTNFVKLIGNTNIPSITDIFVLYDPKTYIFQSWIITNMIDTTTQEQIVAPLLYFNSMYSPINCPTGMYYDNKCLPPCPGGFDYDLGLICLNSNSSNYFPDTPICNYINSIPLPTPVDPTIAGIKLGCDRAYFDKTKVIRQVDVTGPNFTLPQDTSISNNGNYIEDD